MYNFRHDYKKRTFGFGNIDEGRFIRARRTEESRKRQRTNNFNSNRQLPKSFFETPNKGAKSIPVKENRMTRLVKWKAEREKVKKFQQTKKKPPFIVGLVHHKLYSPLNKDTNSVMCNHQSKRVTRVTQKKLLGKTLIKKVNSEDLNKNSKNITKEVRTSRRSQNRNDLSFINRIATEFPQVPLFGRVPLYSMSPATVMPLIKRRTMARRSTKEFNVNITKDSPTKRRLLKLSFDGKKASNLCNDNTNDKNDNKLTKPIRNKAIKPAQNKTNTKTGSSPNYISVLRSGSQSDTASFSPYIVSRCGKNNARKEEKLKHDFRLGYSSNDDTPTKGAAMKNLSKEADQLSKLCEKWMKPIVKKETTDKKKVAATKSSELISNLKQVVRNRYKKNESHIVKYKTKAISIDRNKKKVTPMKHGKRLSLLQKVQLSDTLNKTESPLTIMKRSQVGKIPKVLLNDSISYISSDQTPKKNILRQQRNLRNIEYGMKSASKVNINDHSALNKVSVNEESKTKLDLAVVLSRIDDYYYILKEKLEKDVDMSNKDDMEEHNEATKVLRNRIVTSTDTPLIKKRSFRKLDINLKELEHKENETPLQKGKTRSSLKPNIKNNEKTDIDNFDNNISVKKNDGKRRSPRSIKFSGSEKECSDYRIYKETLPMTAHTRKKIYSNNKEWDSIFKEDPVSLEIKEKPSKRVRRSQNRKVRSDIY